MCVTGARCSSNNQQMDSFVRHIHTYKSLHNTHMTLKLDPGVRREGRHRVRRDLSRRETSTRCFHRKGTGSNRRLKKSLAWRCVVAFGKRYYIKAKKIQNSEMCVSESITLAPRSRVKGAVYKRIQRIRLSMFMIRKCCVVSAQ